MMAKWMQILPVFIYKRLARKWCMRIYVGKTKYIQADKEILVKEL